MTTGAKAKLETDGVYADFAALLDLQFKAVGFNFLPRQKLGSLLGGKHGARLRGRGLDFDELRHYRPGDDIRMLDWKVTKRTGKPHVRVFREERERQALLLVDQRTTMFFGSQLRMKSVAACELAAVAAWRVFGVGDRVGALLFNDTGIVEIKPRRSRKAVLHLLGELQTMNHELGARPAAPLAQTRLNETLREAERLAVHDCLVFIISDLDGWDGETLKRIKRLGRHNDVIAGLVFDPLEQQLPALKQLVVSDGLMQIQVDTARAGLQSGFAQRFQSAVEQLQAELHRHGVPVIPLDTVRPVDEQLRLALGAASVRGVG